MSVSGSIRHQRKEAFQMAQFTKILCPIDFSEPSHIGLETAIELAGRFPAELILLHVVPTVPVVTLPEVSNEFNIENYEKELSRTAGERMDKLIRDHIPDQLRSRSMVVVGEPAYEIPRVAEEEGADLIVIATHGESGWRRFLFGSVADKVVRTAKCPVLAVPEPVH
jgi:nucleotide-binding universal stress UspA family protein